MPNDTVSHAPSSIVMLTRHAEVARLADQIRRDGAMALDTEFISENSYRPALALLQVATRDGCYLIDPLVGDPDGPTDDPIWEAMADPSVRTIVHAHEHESQFCLQRSGQPPGNLFDVQLAAAFSGHHFPIAYGQLVESEFRTSLGPSQSRTNWLRRPLTDAQQRYAADDVRWLFKLHDRFLRRWERQDQRQHSAWLREETSQRLVRMQERDADRWRRMSGVNKLSRRARAVLRELAGWRDALAERRNVPRQRVADDNLLVAIAATCPTTTAELSSVRGAGKLKATDYESALERIVQALQLPEEALPELSRQRSTPRPQRAVVLFLESVLAAACAEHGVSSEVVGGSAQLRSVIAWHRNGRHPGRRPELLSGWRAEVIGDALVRALDGQVTLRIDRPHSKDPVKVEDRLSASRSSEGDDRATESR